VLWRVHGSGLSLLGSVHVLDVPTLPLSAAAWAAFGAATRVVFEHDLTQTPDVSFAQLPADEVLSSLIPAALYTSVEERCREWSMDIDWVSRFQPWFVGLSLSVKTAALASMIGANGVDGKLLALAQTQGKAIEYLEGASAALRTFANAPIEEQRKMLSFAAEDVQGGIDYFKKLIDGWKARRADLVLGCVQDRMMQMPTMFGNVIVGRNRSWLPHLMALAKEPKPTLAVVGALHVVGPTGLPTMLRKNGHEMIAVDVTGE
jgi:hypothetical protein